MKTVGEREIALGVLSTNRQNDDARLFLESGEIISLSESVIYQNNTEYMVNGNPARKVWFSQICTPFMNPSSDELHMMTGCIEVDGQRNNLIGMSISRFTTLVKGRKFRVSALSGMVTFNRQSPIYGKFNNDMERYNYVKRCVQERRYGDINNLTKAALCYSLIEVK